MKTVRKVTMTEWQSIGRLLHCVVIIPPQVPERRNRSDGFTSDINGQIKGKEEGEGFLPPRKEDFFLSSSLYYLFTSTPLTLCPSSFTHKPLSTLILLHVRPRRPPFYLHPLFPLSKIVIKTLNTFSYEKYKNFFRFVFTVVVLPSHSTGPGRKGSICMTKSFLSVYLR